MAVVWQNTFDGPVGNNLTPINSANYGDPILDNQRNGNPANAEIGRASCRERV